MQCKKCIGTRLICHDIVKYAIFSHNWAYILKKKV